MKQYEFENNMVLRALRDSSVFYMTKGDTYRIVDLSLIGSDWIVIVNDTGERSFIENATHLLGNLFTVIGKDAGINTIKVF